MASSNDKNLLVLKYPSAWWGAKWREALPAGNGTVGAGVYGAVHNETILLTHEDLWHKAKTLKMPDVSSLLPTVRRLLLEDKPQEADGLIANELKQQGYDPSIGSPLPLGDLKIQMPVHMGFRDYRRVLNMETGEVDVTWTDNGVSYRRSLFVSRTDDVVVMEVESQGGLLELDLQLDLHDRADAPLSVGGIAVLPVDLEVIPDEQGWIHYAARNDDGSDFGAVARVVPLIELGAPAARMTVKDGGLHLEGCPRALVVIKVFVLDKRQTAWEAAKNDLKTLKMDYPSLLAPHAAEHGALFNRVQLNLEGDPMDHARSSEELLLEAYQGEAPTALVEKMWALGRYLLICSSRPGGQPCPLHGKWCGSYKGYWTFHMANENLQMIYWQSLSGQLAETHLPVFDYFDRMMDDFRENAQKLYGCRGIYVPAVSTPESGLLKCIAPHIIHWTGAAAWLAHHYFDYYEYTGDEAFLRERALPFLRETALFYEDFFEVDEEGFYRSAPSNSPENTPGNHWDGKAMGASMEITMNATMDFALAREVLTHLVEAATILGFGGEEVKKWGRMLKRIPPYKRNEDESVAEWMHSFYTDNNHHRHQSHIYPLFPGNEVTATSDPALFAAFERTIEKRLNIGISEQTGWSLAHMANVYARLKRGNKALNCLNLMSRSCLMNNLFTTHNDWRNMGIGVDMAWAPFQIDANMGWSAAVQEMLLQSEPSRVCVLPALPDHWSRGSVSGLVARGNIQVSIEWDLSEKALRVELVAKGVAQTIDLELPFGDPRVHTITLFANIPTRLIFESGKISEPHPPLLV